MNKNEKNLKYRSRSYEYNLVMELSISLDSKFITNNAVLWFKMINLVFLVKAKYFYKNIIEAYSIVSTNICLCAYTDVLMSVVMFLFFFVTITDCDIFIHYFIEQYTMYKCWCNCFYVIFICLPLQTCRMLSYILKNNYYV